MPFGNERYYANNSNIDATKIGRAIGMSIGVSGLFFVAGAFADMQGPSKVLHVKNDFQEKLDEAEEAAGEAQKAVENYDIISESLPELRDSSEEFSEVVVAFSDFCLPHLIQIC